MNIESLDASLDALLDAPGCPRPIAPPRADQALGLQERQALASILEILHAAHQEREQEVDGPLLDERLLEGLIVAGRLIVGPT